MDHRARRSGVSAHKDKGEIMEQRSLGKSGIAIAPLMFGGNVLGWTMDRERSFRVLDAFVDHGLNAIDTADVYFQLAESGVGASERVLGEWMKARGHRARLVIATKVGMRMARDRRGLSRAYIVSAVEESLGRLQTDYIDLYQAHCDDERVPQQETLEAFDSLVRQGKVRAIGASNFTAGRLESALDLSESMGLARYETLQPLYNLHDRRGFEEALQPVAVRRGLGVLPFFSLASGFLTGKYRVKDDLASSARGAFVDKYLTPDGLKLLAAVDAVAAKHEATNAQIALAWIMAQPGIVAPIASATSVEQLAQLVSALDLRLDPDDLRTLDQAQVPQQPIPD
jgi:aryl-alcohol dehydrogenase-like predicted oxidoreductase